MSKKKKKQAECKHEYDYTGQFSYNGTIYNTKTCKHCGKSKNEKVKTNGKT